MTDDTKLSADKVAAFLRQNPEFFQQRSDLLELMRLPDPRGPAVSLLERAACLGSARGTAPDFSVRVSTAACDADRSRAQHGHEQF